MYNYVIRGYVLSVTVFWMYGLLKITSLYFVTKCSVLKSVWLIAVMKCISKYFVDVGRLPARQHNLQPEGPVYHSLSNPPSSVCLARVSLP
jgi:hypothetical protein